MVYVALDELQREQNRLHLNLIRYSLDEEWQSGQLVANLRSRLYGRAQ